MNRRIVLLLMAAMMALLVVAQPAFADGGPKPPPEKCPGGDTLRTPPDARDNWDGICHRTGSTKNPYVAIAPSCTAVREDGPGHLPHNTPAGPGEDIDLPAEDCQ